MKQTLIEKTFIGKTAKADHPITCLNPTETFQIVAVRVDDDHLYFRGEDTGWFGENIIEIIDGNSYEGWVGKSCLDDPGLELDDVYPDKGEPLDWLDEDWPPVKVKVTYKIEEIK